MIGFCERILTTDMIITSACLFHIDDKDVCAAIGTSNYFIFADITSSEIVK